MELFERLREERERLGFSQVVIAEKIGGTKRSVINWESGTTSPSADVMAQLAKYGVDVLYVLTGTRSQSVDATLSRGEHAVLDHYRNTNDEGQKIIEQTAFFAAQSAKKAAGKTRA